MSYQVLARKWRPRTFEELVGQPHVVRALSNALNADRLHHAYLFTGTRGVGKTTVARIFARSLNCETGITATPCGECSACREIDEGRFVDLIEVDAASRTKVDETRELLENVQYAPTRGRFKVYLIDEVHMFSNHSFNALLKTLEEPPPHIKFLLATTDPKKLPVTILSRCLQFSLKRLGADEIGAQIAKILEAEGVGRDRGAIELIAAAADGSMRDGLSLLDQALAYGDGEVHADEVANMLGSVHADKIGRLLALLADGDAAGMIRQVREMSEFGTDFSQALGDLLQQLQHIAVTQALAGEGDDPSDSESAPDSVATLARRISPEDCQLFYQIGLMGRRDLPFAPDSKGGFEMILLRMLAFRPADASREGGVTTSNSVASASGPSATGSSATTSPRRASATGITPSQDAPEISASAPEAGPGSGHSNDGNTRREDLPPLNAEQWPSVVECLGLTGLVHQLAANCAFQLLDGERIDLLLSPRNEQLFNPRAKARMQDALRDRYAQGLTLNITIAENPEVASPVLQQQLEDAERLAAAQQAMKADPNVQALCATFDAEIERTDMRDVS
jgi:DNA polymerase-3 subunit gamma/tau